MRRISYLLAILLLLPCCVHKELCWDHPHTMSVKVEFDWRDAPGADPDGMCVYFYPVGGGSGYRFDFKGTEGGEVKLTVRVTAHTERMEHPDHELYQGALFPEGTQFTTEERSYDNGLSVLLTTVEIPPEDAFYDWYGERLYRAHFAVNGVWYWVDASCKNAPEQARETLDTMLNSFVL